MGFSHHFLGKLLIQSLLLGCAQCYSLGLPVSKVHVPAAPTTLDFRSPPPVFNVTLTPRFDHGRASAIRVDLGLATPKLRAQQTLLTVPIEIVTVDTGPI